MAPSLTESHLLTRAAQLTRLRGIQTAPVASDETVPRNEESATRPPYLRARLPEATARACVGLAVVLNLRRLLDHALAPRRCWALREARLLRLAGGVDMAGDFLRDRLCMSASLGAAATKYWTGHILCAMQILT